MVVEGGMGIEQRNAFQTHCTKPHVKTTSITLAFLRTLEFCSKKQPLINYYEIQAQ